MSEPSCRNCSNSRHWGVFQFGLYCMKIGMLVVATHSKTEKENAKADEDCKRYAARCGHYSREELQ